MAEASSIFSLPADLVADILLHLRSVDLAKVASTCHKLHDVIYDGRFLARCCPEVAGRTKSLAQVHVREVLAEAEVEDDGHFEEGERFSSLTCSFFETASWSLRQHSRDGLEKAARLLAQHPEMRCRIDGHVHVGAPDEVQMHYSLMRAKAVRACLVGHGVEAGRCVVQAWGKKVAEALGWPAGPHWSRAELCFTLDGEDFPPRRTAYADLALPEGQEDEANPEPDPEDDDNGGFGAEMHVRTRDGHVHIFRGHDLQFIMSFMELARNRDAADNDDNDDDGDGDDDGDDDSDDDEDDDDDEYEDAREDAEGDKDDDGDGEQDVDADADVDTDADAGAGTDEVTGPGHESSDPEDEDPRY